MVPVKKKNGQVRITVHVDYKHLNQNVKRQVLMLPNLDDVGPKLAGAVMFSALDAAGGYYQIPLDEKSRALTTFITPFGRYCFLRIPMGIAFAPEVFQQRMHKLLKDQEGCVVVMDDILVFGRDTKEHDERLQSVMETIKSNGLKLNKEKCQIRKSEVNFFGHVIEKDGVKPNPERVKAIASLPPPNNITKLRRYMGIVTARLEGVIAGNKLGQ